MKHNELKLLESFGTRRADWSNLQAIHRQFVGDSLISHNAVSIWLLVVRRRYAGTNVTKLSTSKRRAPVWSGLRTGVGGKY